MSRAGDDHDSSNPPEVPPEGPPPMGEMLEELPNDDLVVDRCLCAGVTFEELLGAMRAKGWDLERAQRETGCGETCRMCVPYLRMMVESGRVRFELDEHLRLD